ncbi:phytolongin Phyl1.1-like [Populus alba x Populus x berolinensis]|uniref:Longin domain-containing protein n=1 Tax=Populus davidiana TaxID=266767 RepID=A0A6M2EW79_9ROSI|nr:phytolongin Phyl1.1-like [Populus alba x Populus x berolinensis]
MSSMHNTVHYCCVAKGNRTLYVYSGADIEIENVAALCLERPPSYHKWYFETIAKKTFGFFIEDGFVYFTIVDEGLGNPGVLQFLEHVRDEFKKVARKGSRGSFSGMNSINIQEQLVPVIRRLITSLEHVSSNGWAGESSSSDNLGLSPSPVNANGQIEVVSSTKAPLLGKPNKQDKRKSKDHAITIRDIELEEHRKSTDRGAKLDSTTLDSNNQAGVGSSISLQKDLGSMRIRASSQSIRKKWWRQVRIVLAIDVAICLILFVIWLSICGGFGCTH